MKYEKRIVLKNGREGPIRNAAPQDAQDVLENILATHAQTNFLAFYREEPAFNTTVERQLPLARENVGREVFLCAFIDEHLAGTASVNALGSSCKIRHRADFSITSTEASGPCESTAAAIECARNVGYASWRWKW